MSLRQVTNKTDWRLDHAELREKAERGFRTTRRMTAVDGSVAEVYRDCADMIYDAAPGYQIVTPHKGM
jgi:hypothetical protein